VEIKQPFFSVIIPTTGGRLENLELVLTSLSQQIFPKQLFEVIVVNDGGEEEAYDLTMGFANDFGHNLTYIYTDKYEPLLFGKSIDEIIDVEYRGYGHVDEPEGKIPNIQPRNKGVEFAISDFFIFADSDIILPPTALACYFQDILHNPSRIILGVYHWLYPMHITPNDVITRFDDIINERLAKKLLTEIEPKQTHNIMRDYIMRDYRMPHFNEYPPDKVFKQPGHMNLALACFSGNICWPRTIFEDVGGYTPYLSAGAHEDGFSGIALYKRGHGISFDGRIVGGHLYHPRNVQWVEDLKWKRGEIMWLNEQHADCPEMTDIIEMTRKEMELLGVGEWKDKGGLGW